jgi:hypothetical protein
MMQPPTISDTPEGFTDRVLQHAWNVEFRSALQIVPFALWNESVFRWHFVKSAIALYRDELRMQLEWHRFDLLVQEVPRELNHFIEFKCFVRNKHRELDGSEKKGWKGGPGALNYKEFEDCVEKLVRASERHDVDERRLVVVYPDHPADCSDPKRDYTYSHWYENLPQFNNPALNSQIVPHKRLPPIAHLHRGKPIELKCVQFKIVAPPQDA